MPIDLKKESIPKQSFTMKSVLLFLILFLTGSILTVYSSSELIEAYKRKAWPAAVAKVLESSVVETGSMRPLVIYAYEVESKTYVDSSFLQAPGFGNRARQYDVGMKLSRKYTTGKLILIHYDPQNFSESVIIITPTWDTFVKVGLGFVLLITSMFYLLNSVLLRKKEYQSPEFSSLIIC